MSESERLVNRDDREPGIYDRIVRPMFAECVGVTLFVFVGICSTVAGDIVGAALGHGLTIGLLVMGLGEISGGHFNPAVTLGVAIGGGMPPFLAPLYLLAQLFGGVLGAAIVRGVLPAFVYMSINGGTHQLGSFPETVEHSVSVEPGWGFLIETMLTTVLVFTVLMTAVNQQTKTNLAPLAIGFAVAVDIMAGGALTGASMNPARAFGPAVCATAKIDDAWAYHWIYWLGPALGAIIASILYKFLFSSPDKRWVARIDTM